MPNWQGATHLSVATHSADHPAPLSGHTDTMLPQVRYTGLESAPQFHLQ